MHGVSVSRARCVCKACTGCGCPVGGASSGLKPRPPGRSRITILRGAVRRPGLIGSVPAPRPRVSSASRSTPRSRSTSSSVSRQGSGAVAVIMIPFSVRLISSLAHCPFSSRQRTVHTCWSRRLPSSAASDVERRRRPDDAPVAELSGRCFRLLRMLSRPLCRSPAGPFACWTGWVCPGAPTPYSCTINLDRHG